MKCVKCGTRVTWDTSAGLDNHLYCMDCVEKAMKKYHESLFEAIEFICYEDSLRKEGINTIVNDI